jgi:hypothetical protein
MMTDTGAGASNYRADPELLNIRPYEKPAISKQVIRKPCNNEVSTIPREYIFHNKDGSRSAVALSVSPQGRQARVRQPQLFTWVNKRLVNGCR